MTARTARLATGPLCHVDDDRERREGHAASRVLPSGLWPELDVQMVSVTEQWAQFSIAGPRARDTLAKLISPTTDISNAGLPIWA